MNPKHLKQEVQHQLAILKFGTLEITPEDEFIAMLAQSIETSVPLRVKCGIDPTRTDVHLGHFVPYRKMRAFQDLGHTGIVIIGDYTARIGDPTGRDTSRPTLSREQVLTNCKFYEEQLLKVLNPKQTEFRYQSEWYEGTSLEEVLSWGMQTTVAKLISHETFAHRIKQGLSLGLHELLYPVLQGIDSVEVKADVELGGSDQKFNVLMGRDYQRHRGLRAQCAMLMPLVTGLDGKQKMSSSLDNYIGIQDNSLSMFGKIMSAPDHLILEYFKYLANIPPEEYQFRKEQQDKEDIHPNEAKKQLATQVVTLFYGEEVAKKERQQFEQVFAQKKLPDHIPAQDFISGQSLLEVVVESGLFSSKSEVRRVASQGGMGFVEGDKILDPNLTLESHHGNQIIKMGKRKFLKLKAREDIKEKKAEPQTFVLFSDGACRGNPGPGAWGSLGENPEGEVIFESAGVEMSTTNNRMEIEGAIRALNELENYLNSKGKAPENTKVSLYSDSRYVVDGVNEWVARWKKRGWKKKDGKAPENLDLWKKLEYDKNKFFIVTFHWIKGHSGYPQNERCDLLANQALDELGVS